MKKHTIKIIIILSMLLCGCPEKYPNGHKYIKIINRSNREIRWTFSYKKINEEMDLIYDCDDILRFTKVDSTELIECSVINLENKLNNSYYFQIILVDGELRDQYYKEPCDTFRKYVPILHRYKVTLEYLQQMNWEVIYPPEEEKDDN